MKIGIDARLWNQTGVGRYIRNLVINLQRIDKKNDYVLFVRSEDQKDVRSQIKSDFAQAKFKVQNCDIKWHSIKEQILFSNVLNRENLDLVHFPYYSVPVFYRKPYVVTLHDLISLHFQTGKASTLPFPFYKFKFFAYRFIVSQAAKRSKKIIAPSNATKEDIVRYLKVLDSKIEVIYEGVDEGLRSKKSSKKENIFLYVGNAYPHKNLEFLVEVFNNLPQDFRLIMVGKEDYFYKRLKNKVQKLGLLGKIHFFGKATDVQLSDLYKKSKALIIPSFIEGFGLPALEAMVNECLVLASDIPALHEVGGDAVVYFNQYSVEDLANKIKNLDVFKGKVKKGIVRARQFSWEKTAQETLKLYESCASASSA